MLSFEFLIRKADGKPFDFREGEFVSALHIKSEPAQKVEGHGEHCLALAECQIILNDRMSGVQVVVKGELSHEQALKLVNELAENVAKFKGEASKVLDLNDDFVGMIISF